MSEARPRLIFVTGPGGAGKTTIALALARLLAQRGTPVQLVRLSGSESGPPGVRIAIDTLDGEVALAEYLAGVLPVGLGRRLTMNRVYADFINAAPGLADFMAIGKLATGSDRAITIVDGPTARMALALFGMADAAARLFGGWVGTQAAQVAATLRDAERSRVVLVTRADAVARSETRALAAALATLELPLGRCIVNAMDSIATQSFANDPSSIELPFCARDPLGAAELDTLGTRLEAVLA